MDLGDFKQLINVFETEEDFIDRYLIRKLGVIVDEEHFLF